jgi:hypothetical protein
MEGEAMMPPMECPAIVWTETEIALSTSSDRAASVAASFVEGLSWLKQEARLAELRRLKDGWDGESGHAPSHELVDSIVDLMRQWRASRRMPAPSRIVPTAGGTVFIEWQRPPEFVSVEIGRPYEGEWLVERDGYPAQFWVERWSAPLTNKNSSQWTRTRPITEERQDQTALRMTKDLVCV